MVKVIETIRNLFPLLQPEWIFCEVKDVPADVLAAFYEEEHYLKNIGKTKIDIKIKGYRYKLSPKKEIFMIRRRVSLI